MNILIFTAIYPAPAEYGIPSDTKVVHYYAKQWREAGHSVRVVYLHLITVRKILSNLKKLGGFESDYCQDGIDVHLLEYQAIVPKINYLSAPQARDASRRIKKFLAKAPTPDRVFVHFPASFRGVDLPSELECPSMAVLHNVDVSTLRKKPNTVKEICAYKYLGGRSRRICEAARELVGREAELVLSGIDGGLIAPASVIEQRAERGGEPLRIVFAGNLIKLKRVDTVIRALAQVGFDFRFEIIGDGVEQGALKALAGGDERIRFLGRLSREETVEKMREADVFVMVSSPETFGLVYIEAMAQGCITVGSKNEGIDGVIRDGENGFLVESGNVKALTECFEMINKMTAEQRKALVANAYRDASNMTDRAMADKYFEMCR